VLARRRAPHGERRCSDSQEVAASGMACFQDVPIGYAHHHLALFEPRIGFAWDPKGDGRQSIRASYSIG
jgi:hypothetical protein